MQLWCTALSKGVHKLRGGSWGKVEGLPDASRLPEPRLKASDHTGPACASSSAELRDKEEGEVRVRAAVRQQHACSIEAASSMQQQGSPASAG